MTNKFSSRIPATSTNQSYSKSRSNASQQGRSMVEMLGVLAIIGVLSVGAIAGYQKAMFKYRANKQTEILNHLIDGFVYLKLEHPSLQGKYGAASIMPILAQQGFINFSGTNTTDPFNLSVGIEMTPESYKFIYKFSPSIDMDICLNMMNMLKARSADIWFVHFAKTGADESGSNKYKYEMYYGDEYCSKTNCIRNLSLKDMQEFCSPVDNFKTASFSIVINKYK